MILILALILGVTMVISAVLVILLKDLITAVVAMGLVSLFASILYLLLAAPDVAMTEAAIGAGLSTVIFLYTVKKTSRNEVQDD